MSKANGIPASDTHSPADAYPVPPFAHQKQPFPGPAGKMNLRPDRGEASCRGSERLAGKKALITGGDSGIGRAVAIAFSREGADVVMNSLPAQEEDAQEVVALIRAENGKAVAIPGDIREESFCQLLVSQAAGALGGHDILVNNAGRQQFCESITDLSTEDFDATFKTNVYALFRITKASLEYLPRGASIINTSSVQAFKPSDILRDYSQTRAAIVAFTKSLAKQPGQKGIRVNAVAPGPYWTDLQCCGG